MICEIEGCNEPSRNASRCDAHWKCDDCGKKEGLCYRLSGVRCEGCNDVYIERRIADFAGDTTFTPLAVCPWCGYEDRDSFEFGDSDDAHCGECERQYPVERCVEVSYSTTRIDPAETH